MCSDASKHDNDRARVTCFGLETQKHKLLDHTQCTVRYVTLRIRFVRKVNTFSLCGNLLCTNFLWASVTAHVYHKATESQANGRIHAAARTNIENIRRHFNYRLAINLEPL